MSNKMKKIAGLIGVFVATQVWAEPPSVVSYRFTNGNEVQFAVGEAGYDRVTFSSRLGEQVLNEGLTVERLEYSVGKPSTALQSRGIQFVNKENGAEYAYYNTNTELHAVSAEGHDYKLPCLDCEAHLKLLQHGKESYLLASFPDSNPSKQGTYLIRGRDGKALKFSHSAVDVSKPMIEVSNGVSKTSVPTFEVQNGILSLHGIDRKLDLNAFTGELNFQTSVAPDKVLGDDNRPSEAMKLVKDLYIDLIEQAAARPELFPEMIDPELLESMAQTLKLKGSLVITGARNVGRKSAIRAFAAAVARGEVPGIPRTFRLFVIDLTKLSAGTKFVGTIDNRIGVLMAAAKEGAVAYEVEDMSQIRYVGRLNGEGSSLPERVQAAMAKGEFIIIGTDDAQSFAANFSSVPGFKGGVELINLKAPEKEREIEIINLMSKKRFDVIPSDEVREFARTMSEKYDSLGGSQPGNVLDLLKIANDFRKRAGATEFTKEHIIAAGVKAYKYDPSIFSLDAARARLAKLPVELNEKMQGNDTAKNVLGRVVKRHMTGVGNPESLNTAIFHGPPGTGKTFSVKLMSKVMGYEYSEIAMTAYSEYGKVQSFLERIHKDIQENQFRVFNFDEIEKATIEVQNALLGMLQDGKFTYTKNDGGTDRTYTVYVRNSLFFFTSNAGGADAEKLEGDELVRALVRGGISEPLLSRIAYKVYVGRPNLENFKRAVRYQALEALKRESIAHKTKFHLINLDSFVESMGEKWTPESDYRKIEPMIRDTLEEAISDALLNPEYEADGAVEVDLGWESGSKSMKHACLKLLAGGHRPEGTGLKIVEPAKPMPAGELPPSPHESPAQAVSSGSSTGESSGGNGHMNH